MNPVTAGQRTMLQLRNSMVGGICLVVLVSSLAGSTGCSDGSDEADDRSAFVVTITNDRSTAVGARYIEYNPEYVYQVGGQKYPEKTISIGAGSQRTITAYPRESGGNCTVFIILSPGTESAFIFFPTDLVKQITVPGSGSTAAPVRGDG